VQLLPALHSGGVERSTLEISAALVNAGHRSLVVSAGGRLVPALLEAGGEHLTLDIGRKSLLTLRHMPSLSRLFAGVSADIVHARSRLPAWLGLHAVRRLPVHQRPHWVTTVHGLNSPGRYSAVMTTGERVICVSETVRSFVHTHYPAVESTRLQVIPRGVDMQQFPRRARNDARDRHALAAAYPWLGQAGGPVLLLPGRGTRLKGHAHALDLLAALHARGMPARLWLLGTDEPGRETYVADLRAKAQALGIADALHIDVPTTRIAEAYAASDLVLQLSDKPEAFGRTVIEALSVGRPVLGWDHGGVGELLAQLQPSGAVAPGDLATLGERALALLAHPPALPSRIPFTLQAMQRDTLRLYADLAG